MFLYKEHLLLFLLTSSLLGCARNITDVTDPEGLTMKEIYNGSFHENETVNAPQTNEYNEVNVKTSEIKKRNIKADVVDLRGYTRTANNESNILFKRLPNPMLVGYVFPHLTKDNVPIPGYSIPFRMSPKDYWALPGEDRKY